MNSSAGTSSNEWMQFYEQTVVDGTIFTTNTIPPESNLGELTPKGCSSRPMRRWPRASKKKPTTLLNANATNFRALVQQFTGCPTTPHPNNTRGPINLNFALGTEHNRSGATTSIMPAAASDGYYYQQSHQESASYQQQQQQHQQHAVSFDNGDPNALFSSSSGRFNADDPILDGFDLDNLPLQAFNRDFPYSNENDGNYFL